MTIKHFSSTFYSNFQNPIKKKKKKDARNDLERTPIRHIIIILYQLRFRKTPLLCYVDAQTEIGVQHYNNNNNNNIYNNVYTVCCYRMVFRDLHYNVCKWTPRARAVIKQLTGGYTIIIIIALPPRLAEIFGPELIRIYIYYYYNYIIITSRTHRFIL